jgi:hypothetical protein
MTVLVSVLGLDRSQKDPFGDIMKLDQLNPEQIVNYTIYNSTSRRIVTDMSIATCDEIRARSGQSATNCCQESFSMSIDT